MFVWWQLVVLALHLSSGYIGQTQPIDLRLFEAGQMVIEGRIVPSPVRGIYQLHSSVFNEPLVIENSRRQNQVYMIFPSGFRDLQPQNLQPSDVESLDVRPQGYADLQYASGELPPLVVDLTPFLSQMPLSSPGRYDLPWIDQVPDQPPVSSSDIVQILWDTNGMTFSVPGRSLVLTVAFP